MRPDVAQAFDRMQAAARDDGVALVIVSAFRTDAEQAVLFARRPDPQWVAPPGQSLHRNATELDLGPRGAYPWLAAHAGRFHFLQQYPYEPWHHGCAVAHNAVGPPRPPHASDHVPGCRVRPRAVPRSTRLRRAPRRACPNWAARTRSAAVERTCPAISISARSAWRAIASVARAGLECQPARLLARVGVIERGGERPHRLAQAGDRVGDVRQSRTSATIPGSPPPLRRRSSTTPRALAAAISSCSRSRQGGRTEVARDRRGRDHTSGRAGRRRGRHALGTGVDPRVRSRLLRGGEISQGGALASVAGPDRLLRRSEAHRSRDRCCGSILRTGTMTRGRHG